MGVIMHTSQDLNLSTSSLIISLTEKLNDFFPIP